MPQCCNLRCPKVHLRSMWSNSPCIKWAITPWTCSAHDKQNKFLQGELYPELPAVLEQELPRHTLCSGTNANNFTFSCQVGSAASQSPLRQQLWSNWQVSDPNQSLSWSNLSWSSESLMRSRLLHVQWTTSFQTVQHASKAWGDNAVLAIQILAYFIFLNHVDMPNMQQQKFCCQGKLCATQPFGVF